MERWSELLNVVKCGVCLSEIIIHISVFSVPSNTDIK